MPDDGMAKTTKPSKWKWRDLLSTFIVFLWGATMTPVVCAAARAWPDTGGYLVAAVLGTSVALGSILEVVDRAARAGAKGQQK